MKKLKVGSDFSGVGAFTQALIDLELPCEHIFACDMDSFARKTYLACYDEPMDYPLNVYDRKIPEKSLDVYMTSPPCQPFSMAGTRKSKLDPRGILFFNSYEFIMKNKPRFFIFENVKGLLSADSGTTFQEWINYLGGKTVNGVPVIFPIEEAAPYHIYWQVLNAKKHGIPQNRERVFIIGIREDSENVFSFPKEEHLTLRLKDILEPIVDPKYFLSEKMKSYLVTRSANFNSGKINFKTDSDIASSLTASSGATDVSDNIIVTGQVGFKKEFRENDVAQSLLSLDYKGMSNTGINVVKVGYINQDTQASQVFSDKGISPTISAGTHGYALGYVAEEKEIKIGTWRTHEDGRGFRETEDGCYPTIPARAREDGSGQPVIKVPSATKIGYEEAKIGDSINLSNLESKTKRVGVGVANTLDTSCNQAVVIPEIAKDFINLKQAAEKISDQPHKILGYTRDKKGKVIKRTLKDIAGTLTTSSGGSGSTDQFVCIPVLTPDRLEKKQNGRRFKKDGEEMFTITSQDRHGIYDGYDIRRLTPIECFRLMGFPDSLVHNARKNKVSDSQLYKQAGNSIVVRKLVKILKQIKYLQPKD